MKKITSFTVFSTGEGTRVSFTFSEISEKGELLNQNVKKNFIVMDENVTDNISEIQNYIQTTFLED